MAWQVQEAKQRFSELVRRALDEGPQVVSRRGEDVVVVLAKSEFDRLKATKPGFKQFLLEGPDLSVLDLTRSDELPRDVEL
ncbi:MAG TPA: type II toxin-antitoxin system Phd/YefM family antitoxin [Chloroflexota bacterium]|nr:type II toxin-antitoxin system Phd/YefM family antitoxin [Chloroflexota bacterium]